MIEVDWHHAPLHRFVPSSVYMVTSGTYGKQHLFHDDSRLKCVQEILLGCCLARGWKLHAWACLSNHMHWIAMAPETGSLCNLIKEVHSKIAVSLNHIDGEGGRRVMYQFWDTCISYDHSYYARLNYVMNNPVKHGVVQDAELYPFCSAGWFRRNNPSATRA